MNLLQLEYFELVASYQSISKAAEELHVSQPALSNALAKLEEELGVQLFDRLGKKLVLNQRGEEFLFGIRHSMRILRQTTDRVKSLGHVEDTIRIGLRIESSRLFELIREFQVGHPEALFQFSDFGEATGESPALLYDFLVHPDYANYGLPRRYLQQRNQLLAVLPSAHPLAGRKSIRLEELKDDYFAFVSPDGKRLSQTFQICVDTGFSPKVRYTSDKLLSISALVRITDCVGLTWDSDWHTVHHGGDVSYVPVAVENLPHRKIYLGWNEENMRPAAKLFLAFVKQQLPLDEEE